MKNFILSLIGTALLAGILQLFLPWWIVVVAAFATGFFIQQNGFAAFASSFLAIFLLWIVYAYTLSSANDNILASRVAELFNPITQGSVIGLYLFTGLIGGLASGFGGLTGSLAGKLKQA